MRSRPPQCQTCSHLPFPCWIQTRFLHIRLSFLDTTTGTLTFRAGYRISILFRYRKLLKCVCSTEYQVLRVGIFDFIVCDFNPNFFFLPVLDYKFLLGCLCLNDLCFFCCSVKMLFFFNLYILRKYVFKLRYWKKYNFRTGTKSQVWQQH